MNLTHKGEVKEGYDADLVIFDENTIIDRATFEEPTLPPEGISYVLLNGVGRGAKQRNRKRKIGNLYSGTHPRQSADKRRGSCAAERFV